MRMAVLAVKKGSCEVWYIRVTAGMTMCGGKIRNQGKFQRMELEIRPKGEPGLLFLLLLLCHLSDLFIDVRTVLHVVPFVVAHPHEEPAGGTLHPDLVLVGEFGIQG